MPKSPKQQAPRVSASPGAGFSLDDVKQLVRLVEESDVTQLAWLRGSEKVVIRRGSAPPTPPVAFREAPAAAAAAAAAAAGPLAAVPAPPGAAASAGPAASSSVAREAKLDAPGVVVCSPFVGTFYRSPSPDAPPFADVGQKVRKGQTICIIEAMKLMNEIECEVDGTVAEIMVPNATAVEFGEALFRIIPG
jgi:acetyl-CoA carboxylase biotin carboxyl carrier protein